MSRYQRGANFERQLVQDFWKAGWVALRAAGSGSVPHPVPDVVAVRERRILAVECKTTGKDRLSLKKDILALKEFADISGAHAYLAVKFLRHPPRFYALRHLLGKDNYTISIKDDFLSFEMVLGSQLQLP